MRKTKALFMILLIMIISVIPFSYVYAHDVELDPDSVISFPMMIYNGEGKITIDSSITGYELYYQSVEIPDEDYAEIQEIKTNGKTELARVEDEINVLDAELENLYEEYNRTAEEYNAVMDNTESTEEEIEEAKEAFRLAKIYYEQKLEEYNNKVTEYNNRVKELNQNIKDLTPTYIEEAWVETSDGSFSIDKTNFSGTKAYTIWVKLVTSDGEIIYDEAICTAAGTKEEIVAVEAISLDRTTLNLEVGRSYTLIATITPSNATNKSIIWTSSNEDVATVVDGKVTAIAEGTATIIAKTVDGDFEAICEVTVTSDENPADDEGDSEGTTGEENNTEDSNTNNNGTDNNGTDNGSTGETEGEEENDATVKPGILPDTGDTAYIVLIALITLALVGGIAYKKVREIQLK